MPRLHVLQYAVLDAFSKRTLERTPEPDLVMESAEQVASYAHAGRIDGVMSASYLFHSAAISETIAECHEVVDLGCGPATQLAQIASLNPHIQFHGIDLSPAMLESAERHCASLGLTNVRFSKGDITALGDLASGSADGVISTMALHHLPTADHLRRCFAEINRISQPKGALYLTDFTRFRSLKTARYFAYMNAAEQPPIFSLDYENSMRAAFELAEFKALAAAELSPRVKVIPTFLTPMLVVLKTESKALKPDVKARVKALREALPRRYLADLQDMRLFFRLSGWNVPSF